MSRKLIISTSYAFTLYAIQPTIRLQIKVSKIIIIITVIITIIISEIK